VAFDYWLLFVVTNDDSLLKLQSFVKHNDFASKFANKIQYPMLVFPIGLNEKKFNL
jgi:hypothetical protein